MRLRWLVPALLAALALFLLPAAASAQPPGPRHGDESDVLVRVNGTLRLPPEDSADVVVIVNGDAVIEGTVREVLVVVHGNAVVSGTVLEQVTVVDGTLDLRPGARIEDLLLVGDSTYTQADDTVVIGSVSHKDSFDLDWRPWSFISWIFWLALTIATLAAGLLFAAVAGRQLSGAGALLTNNVGGTLLWSLALWVGLPVVAVVTLVTLIGIPLGLALLALLPALAILGYLVVGTRIGVLLLRAANRESDPDHPYTAALVGLILLRLIAFIPVAGFIISGLAAAVGAGAIVYFAWRAWRRPTGRLEAAYT